jgi:hypothetical protein
MIKLKSLIQDKYRLIISENYQLAIKVYKNILSPEDIEFLDKLCRRDYTYKILADLLVQDKQSDIKLKGSEWKDIIEQLRTYNKNFLPIAGFSYDSPTPIFNKQAFGYRSTIINIIKNWPSIAKRNLRQDLAKPRNGSEFFRLSDKVDYLNSHLSFLNNRSPEVKDIILKKIFSSDHPTIEDVLDFVEDKPNLLTGGKAYNKEELYKLVERNDYDLKIVYDRGNIVIVDVTGQSGMKDIGCNSMWCFTYGNEYGLAGEQWDRYSYNGHVYAIIDFRQKQDEPEFIHILIKPPNTNDELEDDEHEDDEATMYNMANEPVAYGNSVPTLVYLTKDPNILNVFKWEDI